MSAKTADQVNLDSAFESAAAQQAKPIGTMENPGSISDLHGPPLFHVGPLSIGKEDARRAGAKFLSVLPTVGGVAGDVVGAVGAAGEAAAMPATGGASGLLIPTTVAATSGLGQAFGRAAELAGRQALGYPPPANIPLDLLGAYGTGMATSVGGQALGGIVRGVAKPFMGAALGTANRAPVEAALENNIRPGTSIFGKGTAVEQAGKVVNKAVEAQKNALADAAAQGHTFDMMPAMRKAFSIVNETVQKARVAPELMPEAMATFDKFMAFVRNHPTATLTPEEAQIMKSTYSTMAKPGYVSSAKGIPIADAEVKINKVLADGAREWLNTLPNYSKPTSVLDKMIDLQPVLSKETVPSLSFWHNPLKVLPSGFTGQAALSTYRGVAPVARALPWGANLFESQQNALPDTMSTQK